jgi:hypothetical protein
MRYPVTCLDLQVLFAGALGRLPTHDDIAVLVRPVEVAFELREILPLDRRADVAVAAGL